jgi:hypothetical protein
VLEGLYESLLTTRLQAQIDEATRSGLTPRTELVDAAEQTEVFARHIRDAAVRALAAESNADRRRDILFGSSTAPSVHWPQTVPER